jgi:hypothetical protein
MSGTSAGSFNLTGAGVAAVLLSGSSAAQITVTGTATGTVSGGLEPRYGRPIEDISAGDWLPSAGSDLFAMLDETPASDTDYVYVTSASTFEVKLTMLADPTSSTGHKVSFRVPDGFTPHGNLRVTLRQGATEIAEIHDGTVAADTVYSHTLSGAEADAITDYTDLRVRGVSS